MNEEYNPNKYGWPAAAVTVVGTLALLFFAYSVHERTYLHPRDPMNQQVYHERDMAAGGAHGASEHGGSEHAATPAEAAPAKAAGH